MYLNTTTTVKYKLYDKSLKNYNSRKTLSVYLKARCTLQWTRTRTAVDTTVAVLLLSVASSE